MARKNDDPFGFANAINWDVVEALDEDALAEVSAILDKVK